VSDQEPFYFPSPDLFGHANAYPFFTRFAAELEKAGFRDRFPEDEPEVRHVAIELLAEHHKHVETIEEEPDLIDDAIAEAREILRERRNG
jgi:hypothetical protein